MNTPRDIAIGVDTSPVWLSLRTYRESKLPVRKTTSPSSPTSSRESHPVQASVAGPPSPNNMLAWQSVTDLSRISVATSPAGVTRLIVGTPMSAALDDPNSSGTKSTEAMNTLPFASTATSRGHQSSRSVPSSSLKWSPFGMASVRPAIR